MLYQEHVCTLYFAALLSIGSDFVFGFIQAMDGEKVNIILFELLEIIGHVVKGSTEHVLKYCSADSFHVSDHYKEQSSALG